MLPTRREVIGGAAAATLAGAPNTPVTRYVRFRQGTRTSFGLLEGDSITPIQGDLFGAHSPLGGKLKLGAVKLLAPVNPPKILAVGLNYRSHIGSRKTPERPEIFYKPISALVDPEGPIVIPEGARNVHYEGEMVLVIGKRAHRVPEAQARDAIFGVTCGNDVSERDWQNGPEKDLQWWRAKGADTFSPLGPVIARGLDYSNLLLQTRLNGEVVQKQNTSDLVFGPVALVSFISHYVTLLPGDIIYTGTPGTTRKMNPGDVVEVEVESVGTLRNKIAAA